ncbi:D-alanyl-D-alanine carboxypeptidase family protein [Halotalea alkalilenta]|nr:D-alanyl-D-alanine carboxypeptidase family protein [Halotalea alkalilenta]
MSRSISFASLASSSSSILSRSSALARAVLVGWLSIFGLSQAMPALAVAPPSGVEAPSWLLLDGDSGQVLAEHDADQRRAMASLTKLMTTFVVFRAIEAGRLDWDETVTVPQAVREVAGDESKMYLVPGERISIASLMRGLIIASANDAAITLAVAQAGDISRFVAEMNQEAARLGMRDTRFANVSGITAPGHYSTARDLGRLALALTREFPGYYQISAEPVFRHGQFVKHATNLMVGGDDRSVDGLKTGYTSAAGYCVIASAKRPQANGGSRRMFAVVLGADSDLRRFDDAKVLLDYGYNRFRNVQLARAGVPFGDLPIWKGASDQLGVATDHDLVLSLPDDIDPKGLRSELVGARAPLLAPISAGEAVGSYRVLLGERVVASGALYAVEPVAEGGFISRTVDAVRLLFGGGEPIAVQGDAPLASRG